MNDKVKANGFTMWPLTQRRRNTVFVCAERNDGCHPGDWQVVASTALAWDTKSPGRDSLSFLEVLSNEGE